MQTAAGRSRAKAASDRLDKTVEELGQRIMDDVPQGEMSEVVQRQLAQVPPQLECIPLLETVGEPVQHAPLAESALRARLTERQEGRSRASDRLQEQARGTGDAGVVRESREVPPLS